MNRRSFLSMMVGTAGAPLVPWRGLIDPLIILPAQIPVSRLYKRYMGFEFLRIESSEPILAETEFLYNEEMGAVFRRYAPAIIASVSDEAPLFRRLVARIR